MADNETRLLKAAQGGDPKAFERVLRPHLPMLFAYSRAICGDFHAAEDVVQEAFVAAWYALPTLAEPAALAAWLRSIVRHHAHRVLRRRQLEVVPLTQADGVAADGLSPERRLERHQ